MDSGTHEILFSGVKTQRVCSLTGTDYCACRASFLQQDCVKSIDTRHRRVTTAAGATLAYDVAIVAVGGVTNNYHIPGVDSYTWPFRTVADSLAIEQRFDELRHTQPSLQVVVIGGGISGVEALGESVATLPEIGQRFRFPSLRPAINGCPDFLQIDADLRLWPGTHRVDLYRRPGGTCITPKGVWLASGKRVPSAPHHLGRRACTLLPFA
ncbi:MAG: FAD-dependent oxidoreductase [Rhodoferax sp.]|nr:FAD-dependent oxidoreductase [Rhodoferax sp.]